LAVIQVSFKNVPALCMNGHILTLIHAQCTVALLIVVSHPPLQTKYSGKIWFLQCQFDAKSTTHYIDIPFRQQNNVIRYSVRHMCSLKFFQKV
jgi:hypothetical protein